MADADEPRKSDLPVRIGSAVIMLAILFFALSMGGQVLMALIVAIGIGTYWEWQRLVRRWSIGAAATLGWMLGGAAYVGTATWLMASLPAALVAVIVGTVVFIDTGAYFTGRAIGGAKIAPAISPSKTWAGLAGGMLGGALFLWLGAAFMTAMDGHAMKSFAEALWFEQAPLVWLAGAFAAVAAQAGDFFESWIKRKAQVKDSSRLIPGHGGLFDRVDGLLPLAIIVGIAFRIAA